MHGLWTLNNFTEKFCICFFFWGNNNSLVTVFSFESGSSQTRYLYLFAYRVTDFLKQKEPILLHYLRPKRARYSKNPCGKLKPASSTILLPELNSLPITLVIPIFGRQYELFIPLLPVSSFMLLLRSLFRSLRMSWWEILHGHSPPMGNGYCLDGLRGGWEVGSVESFPLSCSTPLPTFLFVYLLTFPIIAIISLFLPDY